MCLVWFLIETGVFPIKEPSEFLYSNGAMFVLCFNLLLLMFVLCIFMCFVVKLM